MANFEAHTLPDLPYDYDALEPWIDARSLEMHHRRVHRAHVDGLNAVLDQLEPGLSTLPVDDLLREIDRVPEDSRSAIRNRGGGHANHRLLWATLSPGGGGKPTGVLVDAVDEQFGSLEVFKDRFRHVAANLFGSGWIWLILTRGKLVTYTLPNEDSPLLVGEQPLLGLDLWEHAWCGDPTEGRERQLEALWNVVDWEEVGRRYEAVRAAAAQRRCQQPQCA